MIQIGTDNKTILYIYGWISGSIGKDVTTTEFLSKANPNTWTLTNYKK